MAEINFPNIKLTEEEIEKDVENETEELNEERIVGPQDEGDDDPDDTTPAEAVEQADEGGSIIDQPRKKMELHEDWD